MALTLQAEARTLVESEAGHFAERCGAAETREVYRDLAAGAAAGEIGDELAEALGGLLEIGLATGRLRSVYGAHAEMTATSLFRLTPQGKTHGRRIAEASESLGAALVGEEIESVSLSSRGPGIYTLALGTPTRRLVLALDPAGVRIRSLETRG